MDLSDLNSLLSSIVIGAIGMGLFIYGKKTQEFKTLGIGIAMCVYPYFVHSLLLMWGIALVCMASVYVLPRIE
jgi:hypothetical protein